MNLTLISTKAIEEKLDLESWELPVLTSGKINYTQKVKQEYQVFSCIFYTFDVSGGICKWTDLIWVYIEKKLQRSLFLKQTAFTFKMPSQQQYEIPRQLQDILLDFSVQYLVEQPGDVVDFALDYFNRMNASRLLANMMTHSDDELMVSNEETLKNGRFSFSFWVIKW